MKTPCVTIENCVICANRANKQLALTVEDGTHGVSMALIAYLRIFGLFMLHFFDILLERFNTEFKIYMWG